jgi:hypothetical protein
MAERMQVILRVDEELKSRWVEAAQAAGQNLNTWLVAAANAAARVPSTRIHPAPEPSSPRMGVAEEEQRGHGDDATRRDHADPRDEDDARRHAALTTAAAQVREDRASTCEA